LDLRNGGLGHGRVYDMTYGWEYGEMEMEMWIRNTISRNRESL
jgi:hypothetical protein